MKKLLGIVLLSLLLSGCASMDTSFYERPVNEMGGHIKIHFLKSTANKAEEIASRQCKQFNNKSKAEYVRQVHQGSLFTWSEMSYWHYDCEVTLSEEELARIAKAEQIKASEMIKKKKQKKIAQLELIYKDECSDSNDYEKCLFEADKKYLEKQKALETKLAAMTPKQRHSYNCSESFKFKKGTEKFNDCVFKLYTAELDLQKLELEKQVAETKIKAAANEQAKAEAIAKAQIASAKAAKRSSDLNNSIQLMKLGSSLLGGSTPSSSSNNSFDINNRTRTTCRVVGGFLNCY